MIRTLALNLFLLFVVSTAAVADDWLTVKTENFELTSDVGEARAREVIEHLEKVRAALISVTGVRPDQKKPSFRVFGFKSQGDYLKYSGLKRTAGYFTFTWEGPVSMASLQKPRERYQLSGLQIVVHEYVHFFLRSYSSARYPIWYDEGFADFISTIEFEDTVAILGDAHPSRIFTLATSGNWLDLDKILQRRSTSDGNKIAHIYAFGWLLTHYLWEDAERSVKLNTYLNAHSRNPGDPIGVFESSFGMSPKEMDREVRAYWRKGALKRAAISIENVYEPVEPEIIRYSAAKAKAAPYLAMYEAHARTLNNAGRRKKAVKAMTAYFKAEKDPVYEAIVMAELATHGDTPEDAIPILDKGLKAAPNNPRLSTMRFYLQTASKSPAILTKEEVDRYTALFDAGIAAEPTYLPIRYARGRLALSPFKRVNQQAVDDLEMVAQRWPGNVGLTINYAQLFMKAGELEFAREQITALRDSARGEQARDSLDRLLAEIEAKMNPKGKPTAPVPAPPEDTR